ncbi:PBP1A family penicillin-binding protein [Candidatus Uhrbacteria bacterium]|nr:PBP1A family penicillin-binding protein [Candidatus Uhrbacteria bacterium]
MENARAKHRLLFIFRAAWAIVMALIVAVIAAVAHEAVGDIAVTISAAVMASLSACGVGWPRLVMPARQPPPRWWSLKRHLSSIRILACLLFVGGVGATAEAVFLYRLFEPQLPKNLLKLTEYEPMKVTRVLSAEGEVIGEFFLEKRIVVGLDAIPVHVRQAFVAAEDKRFYRHHGIDKWRILKAAETNLQEGKTVQGGSTITQQVVKQLLVGKESSFERKFKEAIMARRVERTMTKDEILDIYLNHCYFGDEAHGLAAAAENYFAKKPDQLTLAEAAMLAGLLPAPARYAPSKKYDEARKRQLYVLNRMLENGFITKGEYETAKAEPIGLVANSVSINATAAPYFVEFVRKYVSAKYGKDGLYRHGLTVHTTISTATQQYAELAVRRGLNDLDLRLGFRGPVDHFEGVRAQSFRTGPPSAYEETGPAKIVSLAAQPGRAYQAMVTGRTPAEVHLAIGKEEFLLAAVDLPRVADWERRFQRQIRPGDIINVRLKAVRRRKAKDGITELRAFLTQQPTIEAAMIVLEPATGKLRAMVGGYDFGLSQFNRAYQGKGRLVGSAIKPFVYAAAIEKGKRETDKIFDGRFSKPSGDGTTWTPRNFGDKYYGTVTLRQALALSLNTAACRLVDEVVGINRTIETMHRLGISSDIPRYDSIAIGGVDVHLMELAYAYATFPAQGREVKPVFIEKIVDAKGDVLFDLSSPEQQRPPRQRMDPADAYIVLDMMRGVVENGTAVRARKLGRPAAGKTGTTNGSKDAWFIGFTADLLAGVWVGRDKPGTIGEDITGGSAALPIWLEFMSHAHSQTPPRDFAVPPGIVFRRGDPRSGLPASGNDYALVPYRRGLLPE